MAEAGTLDRQTEEKHADTSIITEPCKQVRLEEGGKD